MIARWRQEIAEGLVSGVWMDPADVVRWCERKRGLRRGVGAGVEEIGAQVLFGGGRPLLTVGFEIGYLATC